MSLCPAGATKARADLAAGLRADRDVLQVRIRRGQPAGRRRGEREGGVHAPASADACAPGACPCRSISASRAGAIRGSSPAARARPAASSSRSVAGVAHWPVGVFLAPGRPILPNRMSPICFGEPSEKVSPAISWISASSRASVCAKSPDSRRQDLAVDHDAALLHAGEHVDERPLQRLVDGDAALGRRGAASAAARGAASRPRPRRRSAVALSMSTRSKVDARRARCRRRRRR